MKGWSRSLFGLTLVFLVLLATGCDVGGEDSSQQAVPEETTGPAAVDGEIIVASNMAYPPFEFAPRRGPVGFDIDLMNEIAKRAGFEVEYQNVQFDSIVRGLSTGLFDAAISGMTITGTREQQAEFSEPYYNVEEALVVRVGSGIGSTGDLEEMALGVQLGTIGQAEAGELLNSGGVREVRTYRTVEEAFAALESEVVDGVIYDLPAAQEKVEDSGEALELVEVIPSGEQYGIAFPKESPLIEPVNEALAEIKEDGTYEEIYEKWIGRPPAEIP